MPHDVYLVGQGDYANAGSVSAHIKKRLLALGIDKALARRVAIASFEAEMNLVIHSFGGKMELDVTDAAITLEAYDKGPGIANVELAKMEGFSTADEEVRSRGFGAGMGLPNIARVSDHFVLASRPGVGTLMVITFTLHPEHKEENKA